MLIDLMLYITAILFICIILAVYADKNDNYIKDKQKIEEYLDDLNN